MNFSNSFLSEIRTKTSLADLIGEKVTWDNKKSRVTQGDYWAPCPFHDEKTASFHVDDQKGFYYCFGCHQKGDCFTFVKDINNLTFIESVKYLAQRAGVPLPKSSPLQAEKYNKTENLHRVMMSATNFYKLQLQRQNARHIRDYLSARGINQETIEKFELGFAPNSYVALYDQLKSIGVSEDEVIETGLCIISEKNGKPFDRFRNRLMFPIKDSEGKVIAFGGRAIDKDAKAKYLNSPETTLFDKGKSLYNYNAARSESRKTGSIIVVEGYMDVIALSQAGYTNVVAPLGTAITETQLDLLWKLSPEPIIALDGDNAGIRASERLIDISLPYLRHNKTLRFCILPNDQDPDDLIRLGGKASLKNVLDKALPLVNILWQKETVGKIFDSPERKSQLDSNLKVLLSKITDRNLKSHFAASLRKMRSDLFDEGTKNVQRNKKFNRKDLPQSNQFYKIKPESKTKNSLLAQNTSNLDIENRLREGAILLGSINHPKIAHELEQDISQVQFDNEDLAIIRNAILSEIPIPKNKTHGDFLQNLHSRLKFDPIEKIEKIAHLKIQPFLQKTASEENAKKAIEDSIFRHNSYQQLKKEIAFAESEINEADSESLTTRIYKANSTMQKAKKGSEDSSLLDTEKSEKGSRLINMMIQEKIWIKKK